MVIEALAEAIRHRDRTTLEYRSRSRSGRRMRVHFDPESFEFVERHLYVVGVRVDRLVRVAHRVDRITNVTPTGLRLGGRLPARDLRGPAENRVGIWGGEAIIEVRCHAPVALAELIRAEPACRDFHVRHLSPVEDEFTLWSPESLAGIVQILWRVAGGVSV